MAQQPTEQLDAAAILKGIGQMLNSITSQGAQIQQAGADTTQIIRDAEGIASDASRDAETVKAAEQAGILQKQARNSQVINALDWDTQRVELASQLSQQGQVLARLDAEIAKADSVAFTDNPIMWLGAQLAKQGKVSEYNATARSFNLAEERMSTLNTFAQQSAATAAATIETVTAESAGAAARVAGTQYALQAKEMQLKALANNTAVLKEMRALDLDALNLRIKGAETVRSEEEWGMRKQQFADSRKLFSIQLQNAQLEATKRGEEQNVQSQMLALANEGAKHLGRRPFTSYQELQIFSSVKGNKEVADELMNIGYQKLDIVANKGGAGSVTIGATPADASLLLARSRGSLADPKLDALLKSVTADALAGKLVDSQGKPVDLKNPASVEDAINATVKRKFQADRLNLAEGGASNIYAPVTAQEMVTALGGEEKLPALWKTVIAPIAKTTPDFVMAPDVLFRLTTEAVNLGKISPQEAARGLKQLGAATVATVNAVRNFRSVGIPELDSFNAKVKIPGVYFQQDINLLDEARTTNQLLRAGLASRTAKTPGAGYGFGAPVGADFSGTISGMAGTAAGFMGSPVDNPGIRAAAGMINPISMQQLSANVQQVLNRGNPQELQQMGNYLQSAGPQVVNSLKLSAKQWEALTQNSSGAYNTKQNVTETVAPFYPLGE